MVRREEIPSVRNRLNIHLPHRAYSEAYVRALTTVTVPPFRSKANDIHSRVSEAFLDDIGADAAVQHLDDQQRERIVAKGRETLEALRSANGGNLRFSGEDMPDYTIGVLEAISYLYIGLRGQQPRESQLTASMVLADRTSRKNGERGRMIQMETDGGKSIALEQTAVMRALENVGPSERQIPRTVHLMQRNDYLAQREAEHIAQIANACGLTVAQIKSDGTQYLFDTNTGRLEKITDEVEERAIADGKYDDLSETDLARIQTRKRAKAYGANLVVGLFSEFGHDYLRSNTQFDDSLRPFPLDHLKTATVVIDEAEEVAGEEIKSPLVLSGLPRNDTEFTIGTRETKTDYKEINLSILFAEIVAGLIPDVDYEAEGRSEVKLLDNIDDEKPKKHAIGRAKIEEELRKRGLLKLGQLLEKSDHAAILSRYLQNALEARALFSAEDFDIREKDKDGKPVYEVVTLNEHMRALIGRRMSRGLHTALEARTFVENTDTERTVEILGDSRAQDQIAVYDFLNLYEEMLGASGTLLTYAKQFAQVYNCDTVIVDLPRNERLRIDHPDEIIFETTDAKLDVTVDLIIQRYLENQQNPQPILVDLRSPDAISSIKAKLEDAFDKLITERKWTEQKPSINTLLDGDSEEEIARIADAAIPNTILITNIIDRGVDIQFGGTAPEDAKEREDWKATIRQILAKYGHFLIGEHRSNEADRQLRARVGRQDSPAETLMLTSLQDRFMIDGIDDQAYISNYILRDLQKFSKRSQRPQTYMTGISGTNWNTLEGPVAQAYVRQALRRIERSRTAQAESYVRHYEILRGFRRIIDRSRKNIRTSPEISGMLLRELTKSLFHVPAENLPEQIREIQKRRRLRNKRDIKTLLQQRISQIPEPLLRRILFDTVNVQWAECIAEISDMEHFMWTRDQGYISSERTEEKEFEREAKQVFTNTVDQINNTMLNLLFRPIYVSEPTPNKN